MILIQDFYDQSCWAIFYVTSKRLTACLISFANYKNLSRLIENPTWATLGGFVGNGSALSIFISVFGFSLTSMFMLTDASKGSTP